ncbi:MAG: hypothetical protein JWN34_1375 [Bryobacterales bacterium]|jgi:hypothetical protein|nr:hypothetical protein [Bryobacterales bacterium]
MKLSCWLILLAIPTFAQAQAPDPATSEAARKRIEAMRLRPPTPPPIRTVTVGPLTESSQVCAIPLLNAIRPAAPGGPATTTIYPTPVLRPPFSALKGDIVATMPVCTPG